MFYHSKENLKKSKLILLNVTCLLAHKGNGFDSYVVLNNLPHWRCVVSLIRNEAGIVSLKYSTDT